MPKFMFIYHGNGRDSGPPPPDQQEAAMKAWTDWMGGIGSALVDPGNPVGKSKSVASGGVGDRVENPAFGYSVVEAKSLDAACAMAKGNPMLTMGGSVEVAEILPM
jgi:hypothetical protein